MYNRAKINSLASREEVSNLNFSSASLNNQALALLGFQRTKQVSKRSREAWIEGHTAPMLAEVQARGAEIFDGALHEILCEHKPLKEQLYAIGFEPKAVIDIGCGQALPDLLLHYDYDPAITLIDIEHTDNQYHFFSQEGSGYASLQVACDMLVENGVPETKVKAVNPRKTPEKMVDVTGDMVVSFYSCGFHYPVDDYADLMIQTLGKGGVVVLDLRKRYLKRKTGELRRVLDAGEVHEIYEDTRSFRMMVQGGR